MNVKRLSRYGIIVAAMLVLGWVEHLIPIAPSAPGIKLGLSNIGILLALYTMDKRSAWMLMAVKVMLSGLLFSGLAAMLYSLAGGIVSLSLMTLASRIPRMDIVGVSVAGAVGHNIGQIAVAMAVVESAALLGYLPVLLVSAVATGILTAIIARYVIKAISAHNRGTQGGDE